jgi:hypothetical protein
MNYDFDVNEAVRYGLNESILIYIFKFWLNKNKANNNNFHDNHYWTFNSIKALSELFPFWSVDQIRNILKSLVNQGVLITGNYNKIAYDRTKWYAFKDESIMLTQKTYNQREAE